MFLFIFKNHPLLFRYCPMCPLLCLWHNPNRLLTLWVYARFILSWFSLVVSKAIPNSDFSDFARKFNLHVRIILIKNYFLKNGTKVPFLRRFTTYFKQNFQMLIKNRNGVGQRISQSVKSHFIGHRSPVAVI